MADGHAPERRRHERSAQRRGTARGRTLGPGEDDAAGNQYKAYGVGGIMRQPGRLHITWLDDNTLKLDFDAGTQTRIPRSTRRRRRSGEKTWQGYSSAAWEGPVRRSGRGDGPEAQFGIGGGRVSVMFPAAEARASEACRRREEVRSIAPSSKSRPRTFGRATYSKMGCRTARAPSLASIFNDACLSNGDGWLVVTTAVDDPRFLQQPFYTSTNFKREPNGSKWNPCPAKLTRPPRSRPSRSLFRLKAEAATRHRQG